MRDIRALHSHCSTNEARWPGDWRDMPHHTLMRSNRILLRQDASCLISGRGLNYGSDVSSFVVGARQAVFCVAHRAKDNGACRARHARPPRAETVRLHALSAVPGAAIIGRHARRYPA